jgi:NitT/TauT family transport system permease protein
MKRDFLGLKKELSTRRRLVLLLCSFLIPLGIWSAVSYIPWLWHPQVLISDAGEVESFSEGMRLPVEDFESENAKAIADGIAPGAGERVNPVYLPAPHRVVRALYTAFTTEPRLPDEPWLHQSLAHSFTIILRGFLLSSLIAIPMGILCGSFRFFAALLEPFVEFFRYLPPPVFSVLMVSILGIYDAPKVAIVFIGTFFPQLLVVANSVRKADPSLVEAAQTLGASKRQLLTRVIIPASLPDLYTDMRIALGCAWAWLIIAENACGTSTGISLFITRQGRYWQFENVYAAIIVIGVIGFLTDFILARLGRVFFPYRYPATGRGWLARFQAWASTPGGILFPPAPRAPPTTAPPPA